MVLSMGPMASGITWGVGSGKGGEGCWWSRGSLVSSKDGIGGSLWHVGHLQGAGGSRLCWAGLCQLPMASPCSRGVPYMGCEVALHF